MAQEQAAESFAGGGGRGEAPYPGPVTVMAHDQQYADLVSGVNERYVGRPETVQVVTTPGQVAPVVRQAAREGKRLTVKAGGHCLEDFVFSPDVQVVLDISNMNQVYFDAHRRAFVVEAGAELLDVYEQLYRTWGVTVPGGICATVGVGGHVPGGGWGLLCRQLGLISDYIHAVEVVLVDSDRSVRTVVATREKDDPHHDLWWAHTGGGGGNFGVVTRYWFRTPGATGKDPRRLLPRPPATVHLQAAGWSWDTLTEADFTRLVKNYAGFFAAHSDPDDPYTALASFLVLNQRSNGQVAMVTQVDATVPDARSLLDTYLAQVTEGVGARYSAATTRMGEFGPMPHLAEPRTLRWLEATRYMALSNPNLTDPTLRQDYKSAYMNTQFPDDQVAALYKHLTRPDIQNPGNSITLSSYGGRVNAVAPDATAFAHRSSAFKLMWMCQWNDPADDEKNITWNRECYEEVYAKTGGVPVSDGITDGCYVNYPDIDLNDPAHNRSGVPWYTLYYKDNYPRLQRVKRRYDPRNFFRHAQSIRLP
ncbi:FAD-binding oxidoreductase [Streptomyces niger]|uniref:FAD-binding oxidoreductase n=1 Tax=Streptomyces niger TaxID=66373 RepID=UPI000A776BC0|nr:FAD-binding oxidoreductase [Streptomyces niger]